MATLRQSGAEVLPTACGACSGYGRLIPDRATGLLLLARALKAGLHIAAPAAMDDAAARAFCLELHQRLSLGSAPARLPVMPEEQMLIDGLSNGDGPLPLPHSPLRYGIAPCAVTFSAHRSHLIAQPLRRAG